jgi:hypothetical protein
MNSGGGEAEVRLRSADICEGQSKSAKNVLGLASTEAKQENRAIASFANRQRWMTVAVPVYRARAMSQPLAWPDAPRPRLPGDSNRINAALLTVRLKLSGCYSVRCHGRSPSKLIEILAAKPALGAGFIFGSIWTRLIECAVLAYLLVEAGCVRR